MHTASLADMRDRIIRERRSSALSDGRSLYLSRVAVWVPCRTEGGAREKRVMDTGSNVAVDG